MALRRSWWGEGGQGSGAAESGQREAAGGGRRRRGRVCDHPAALGGRPRPRARRSAESGGRGGRGGPSKRPRGACCAEEGNGDRRADWRGTASALGRGQQAQGMPRWRVQAVARRCARCTGPAQWTRACDCRGHGATGAARAPLCARDDRPRPKLLLQRCSSSAHMPPPRSIANGPVGCAERAGSSRAAVLRGGAADDAGSRQETAQFRDVQAPRPPDIGCHVIIQRSLKTRARNLRGSFA